jgi:hypothetical protein
MCVRVRMCVCAVAVSVAVAVVALLCCFDQSCQQGLFSGGLMCVRVRMCVSKPTSSASQEGFSRDIMCMCV